ncbi:EAL domain-containing protein [Niallia sp.]|uniref:EAL domain-containing protein n=1 Tax=Niallia sp. TaxID=2837523 RepID=UPI0028A214AD|nr:EAL domain-containing protein [Niallia sp.]
MARFNFLKEKKLELEKKSIELGNVEYLLKKEAFNAIFEKHPDIVFALDNQGQVLHCNPTVKQILGYEKRDLDKNINRIYVNHHLRKKYIKRALNGESQNFKADIIHINGQILNFDITYVPIMGEKEQILGIYGIAKEITMFIKNKKELLEVKENLEFAQQVTNIGSWEYSIGEDKSYWSNQTFEMHGIKNKALVPSYKDIVDFIHPEDRHYFNSIFQKALKNRESYKVEYRIKRADGTSIYVFVQAEVIVDEDSRPLKYVGVIQDITKRKIAEKKLVDAEERFRNIYNSLEVGISSFDVVNNKFLLTSPGIKFVTGYSAEELVKMGWESIIHPDDLGEFQQLRVKLAYGESLNHTYRISSKDGEVKWVQDQTIPVLDYAGNLIRLDGTVSDITHLEKSKEELTYLAYHDSLTDLFNKRKFDEKIEELIKTSKRDNKNFSVLYLNLDRFKQINDRLGHAVGDKLLKQFTIRLNKKLEMSNYLFARLAGDEFGILLWDFEHSDYPITIAKRIVDCMKKFFLIDEYELFITTSVGISTFPLDGNTREELVKKANAALHRAKEMGKNNYQIYSTLLNISSFKHFQLERDLYKAMEKHEFFLHFQPRVDTSTGKMVSAEALIRWKNAEWGFVSPREFIPIAEENGLILSIGDWVFQEVCNRISIWKSMNLPIVPISINISAQRLLKSDFIPTVIETLRETKTDPALIEFEITETTLIQYEEIVTLAVQQLKEIGIRIALDDFGTGYSSLTYLKQYPIDTIKLDRSFVRNITDSKKDEMIVKSMIFLAKGLDMKIVAEGVETKEQLALLKQQECDEIQGYLFSKSVGEEEFQMLMQKKIIKPQEPQWESREMSNRRNFYRINLLRPLEAKMSLVAIKGKKVQLGKTEILIEDIGIGGIKILSNIDLPVRPDIALQFETLILNEKVGLFGHIVWKHEVNDIYQYGIQFVIQEKERDYFAKLFNKFCVQYRKNPFLPNCSFIKEEKMSYLKNLHS